jgi:hypothetical protein
MVGYVKYNIAEILAAPYADHLLVGEDDELLAVGSQDNLLNVALIPGDVGQLVAYPTLAAVPVAGLEAVLVAVELVLDSGAVSAEHVLNVLGRLNASAPPDQVETALRLSEAPRADTGRYDSLRGQEVDHA